MTEDEVRKGSATQPRPLTDEEAEGIRLFMRRQEGQKVREAMEQRKATAKRLAIPVQQEFVALPKLPVGWANGFKTSEFWTAVAGVVLAVAKGYGYNIPEDAFWGIVAYILGRSGMKSAAAYRSGVKQ